MVIKSHSSSDPQCTSVVCLFCSVSDRKSSFSVRKSILTSKRHAEHPFACQNTQHKSPLSLSLPLSLKVERTNVPFFSALLPTPYQQTQQNASRNQIDHLNRSHISTSSRCVRDIWQTNRILSQQSGISRICHTSIFRMCHTGIFRNFTSTHSQSFFVRRRFDSFFFIFLFSYDVIIGWK